MRSACFFMSNVLIRTYTGNSLVDVLYGAYNPRYAIFKHMQNRAY